MGDYFENKEWYDQDSSLIYDHDPLTSKDSLRFFQIYYDLLESTVSDRTKVQLKKGISIA